MDRHGPRSHGRYNDVRGGRPCTARRRHGRAVDAVDCEWRMAAAAASRTRTRAQIEEKNNII